MVTRPNTTKPPPLPPPRKLVVLDKNPPPPTRFDDDSHHGDFIDRAMSKLVRCSSLRVMPGRKRLPWLVCAALFIVSIVVLTASLMNQPPRPVNHHHRHQPISHHFSTPYFESVTQLLENQLFVSVKTTKDYHYPRAIILLETWASLLSNQVY